MDEKSQYTPFNSESQKIDGLVNTVVVKDEPEKDDSNMTIFGIIDNIFDNFKNEKISEGLLDRIHDAIENRLKHKFYEYEIVTTDEERNTLIKAMIEEYFGFKFQPILANTAIAFLQTTFLRISFKTLKNILNPAIKNVKIEFYNEKDLPENS